MPISDTQEQTAHRQHPVPQNIMSVEFKLVGDLTIRQFVYLVVGGITVYLSFISKLPFLWKWSIIFLGGFGGLALAFVPLGDRGLDQWIKNFIKSVSSPTQKVWKKIPTLPQYFLSDYAHLLKSEVVALAPTRSRKILADYLEGIQEKVLSDIDSKEESYLASLNFGLSIPNSLKSMVNVKEFVDVKVPLQEVEIPKPEIKTLPTALLAPVKKEVEKEMLKPRPEFEEVIVVKNIRDLRKIPPVINTSISRVLTGIPLEGEIILPRKELVRERLLLEKKPAAEEFDIAKHRNDLLKKAEELRETLKKAKEKFSPYGAVLPAQELTLEGREDKKLSGIVETLKSENKRFAHELQILKSQMESLDKSNKNYQERFLEYQEKIKKLEGEKELVQKTLESKKVREKEAAIFPAEKSGITDVEKGIPVGLGAQIKITPADKILKEEKPILEAQKSVYTSQKPELQPPPVKKPMPKIKIVWSKERKTENVKSPDVIKKSILEPGPNVIWGEVRDKNKMLLENATLIIRDEKNDPVWALKTNKLGQFKSSTPLANGKYKIEILNKENSFAIIEVILTGNVISPIKFLAKNI